MSSADPLDAPSRPGQEGEIRAPTLLGVVNVSPESMVRDSIACGPEEVLARARGLAARGVSLFDLGGRSITPDAPRIDDAEEQARLAPAAAALRDAGMPFWVDTWSPATALRALSWGASAINFTAGDAPGEMLEAVARSGASLVLTYMPYGDAYRIRSLPRLPAPEDPVGEVLSFLEPRVARARAAGVAEVVIDPNLGILHPGIDDFEKIHRQLAILRDVDRLRALGCPLLLYAARKPERLARIMMACAVLQACPDYVRTHEPELLQQLRRAARSAAP